MTEVNKVVFSGNIKTSEDFQNIRKSVEEKEFDMIVIDKKSLLSLFNYIEKLQSGLDTNENDAFLMRYDING